jgi:hypothetical protein
VEDVGHAQRQGIARSGANARDLVGAWLLWTLATGLHITLRASVYEASCTGGNTMAKKTLKKAKKLEATKPLMSFKK